MKLQVMSLMRTREVQRRALTMIELIIIIFCLGNVILVLLPAFYVPADRFNRPWRINCCNNLKQIGLCFRTWALDHNDYYPMSVSVTNGGALEVPLSALAYTSFEVMSNELSTPKVLICPADTSRTAAKRFAGLGKTNLSYFLGVDASSTNANMFLAGDDNLLVNGSSPAPGLLNLTTNSAIAWSNARHRGQGNVGLADGSVQQFTTSRLTEALRNTGSNTNRILLP